jgi:hypothetical protein
MVVAVAVSDVLATTIVQFDLEAMTDIAGVVHGIEVVDGSVSDAGLGTINGEDQEAGGAKSLQPTRQRASEAECFCFHVSKGLS